MRLSVEIEGTGAQPPLPEDGAGLAAFGSFCTMRGFGAQHPLLLLAERLDLQHGIRVGPFTEFYDATIEDAEDEAKLELAWQDAARLAESAAAAEAALRTDPEAAALAGAAGTPWLAVQLGALAAIAMRAAEAGARVRLTYTL